MSDQNGIVDVRRAKIEEMATRMAAETVLDGYRHGFRRINHALAEGKYGV